MSQQPFHSSAIKAIIFFIISTALSYTPSQRRRFIRDNCLSAEKFSKMSANFQTLLRKTDDALAGGLKICIIARGVPGRGKTTLVESIVRHYNDNGEFTTTMSASDDFMIDSSGEYCWTPGNLGKAHESCRNKLIQAMEDNIDIVCQHNTNICDWESKELRTKAEALGYITVFIEPTHAWVQQADLPPDLREVLVNVHGVPDKKLSEMIRKKENICPRYLQYVIKPSTLLSDFVAAGVTNQQLNPLLDTYAFSLGKLQKVRRIGRVEKLEEVEKVEKVEKVAVEELDLKGADGQSSSSPSDNPSISSVVTSDVASEITSDMPDTFMGVPFSAVLHVTTDYIGTSTHLLSATDHKEMVNALLSSCKLQVVAIYSDHRGVGALVTTPSDKKEKISESTGEEKSVMKKSEWIDMIKNTDAVPRYQKYTGKRLLGNSWNMPNSGGRGGGGYRSGVRQGYGYENQSNRYEKPVGQVIKEKVPHITLIVNPNNRAAMIGEAAYEFQQQLFQNTLISLQSDAASDSATASTKTEDQIFYFPHKVKIGNFDAILFENPVKFTGTYVGFYSL